MLTTEANHHIPPFDRPSLMSNEHCPSSKALKSGENGWNHCVVYQRCRCSPNVGSQPIVGSRAGKLTIEMSLMPAYHRGNVTALSGLFASLLKYHGTS